MNLPSNIPLSLKVWLAKDNYEHNDDPYTISATGLLNSTKQIILASRVPSSVEQVNVNTLAASRLGSAVHDSIEQAWSGKDLKQLLERVGIPKSISGEVVVNPTPEHLKKHPTCYPVYMEQRASKKVGKYTVSGKFDFVIDGRVDDFKTTGTYTWINSTNNEKFAMQGSIYRWLNPDIITQDEMAIQYIFTDWKAMQARTDPKYPKCKILTQHLPLKSILETEKFITSKLAELDKHWDADEANIPICSDEELWRSAPVHKYYKNPAKLSRSTKNFDNLTEANAQFAQDGGVGKIVSVPGKVMRCLYCDAVDICKQKDTYIADGSLDM
jgi:hypothetical protein